MTKPPSRATPLRRIERLETQIQALKKAERYGIEQRLHDILDLSDLRLRVAWAMSILQTGELPEGADK